MADRFMCRDGSLKAVSSAPSINFTPVGSTKVPLPYPVVADLSNAVSCIENGLFNGWPVLVLKSSIPECKGDSPGSDKGVKSGTVNGEVKPLAGSPTVRAGGSPVVRHGDPCSMQGENSVGTFVAPPVPAPPPPEGSPLPETPPPELDEPPQPDTPEEAPEATHATSQGTKRELGAPARAKRPPSARSEPVKAESPASCGNPGTGSGSASQTAVDGHGFGPRGGLQDSLEPMTEEQRELFDYQTKVRMETDPETAEKLVKWRREDIKARGSVFRETETPPPGGTNIPGTRYEVDGNGVYTGRSRYVGHGMEVDAPIFLLGTAKQAAKVARGLWRKIFPRGKAGRGLVPNPAQGNSSNNVPPAQEPAPSSPNISSPGGGGVIPPGSKAPSTAWDVGFDTSNLQAKLRDYLLNPDHPQNQKKADWFKQALGFDKENWQELASQLRFDESIALQTKATQYGQKFVQVIPIKGTKGQTIDVPFHFMKIKNGTVHLITGIPAKR